jgi:hypothetical protein
MRRSRCHKRTRRRFYRGTMRCCRRTTRCHRRRMTRRRW